MNDLRDQLSLRPFRAEDQDQVRKLILDGLGDHFPEVDPTLNPDLDDIAVSYLGRGHSFVVAELESAIVGAGALMQLDNNQGRIVRVSVATAFRFRGIGQVIVTYLLDIAREKGYRRLLVETNHDWYGAINLYRRCGFLPYDRDDVSIHMQLTLHDM